MERRSVEAIVEALDAAGTLYLVVGRLAVAAHGYVRFTADIDIVLDPAPAALRAAIEALRGLGYRPRASVEIEEFADPEKRIRWMQEKGLTVFSLFSDRHPATEIELFVEPPFDFESAYALAQRRRLARLPLAEKLQWLEDTQRLLDRLRRHRPEPGSPPRES